MKRWLSEAYQGASERFWRAMSQVLSPLSIFVRGGAVGAEATWRAIAWISLAVAGIDLLAAWTARGGSAVEPTTAAVSAAITLATFSWLAVPGQWSPVRRLLRSATVALVAGTVWCLWATRDMPMFVADVSRAVAPRLTEVLGVERAVELGLRATESVPTHFGRGVAVGFVVSLLAGTRFLDGLGYPLRWCRRVHGRRVRRLSAA